MSSILTTPFNRSVTYAAIAGFAIGCFLAIQFEPTWLALQKPQTGHMPHQVAKFKGGISLRFAMVHDVIHERFPLHGKDYYLHRNREVQAQLARLAGSAPATQPTDSWWGLMDDLAVGHVHLGEYEKAITLMREKLRQQEAAGLSGRDLYSTYANLGTAMMIGALRELLTTGNGSDVLRDSISWVQKSIEVNPQAHFGREVWQARLGEFLLDARRYPGELLKGDMIGNQLSDKSYAEGRPARSHLARHGVSAAMMADDALTQETRETLRSYITEVGGEVDLPPDSSRKGDPPVAFDEPTLAIIGMWRYGAGANAHFALCLGETMLKVGQRYIAWSAYERAVRLADGFWPDEQIRQRFIDHCRNRQSAIEAMLPQAHRQNLRSAFEKELALGEKYQREYQQYESDRLKTGASTEDPEFYRAFLDQYGSIASPSGFADSVSYLPHDPLYIGGALPLGLLFAGVFGMLATLRIRSSRAKVAPSAPR